LEQKDYSNKVATEMLWNLIPGYFQDAPTQSTEVMFEFPKDGCGDGQDCQKRQYLS